MVLLYRKKHTNTVRPSVDSDIGFPEIVNCNCAVPLEKIREDIQMNKEPFLLLKDLQFT